MKPTFIDKLAYIHIKDRNLLVTRSRGKDVWYIPGGKREAGETDQQALMREVKEELTVDLLTDTIALYDVFEAQAHGKPERTIVRMTCYMAEFTGELQAAAEIDEIAFFDYAQKHKTSQVDHLIFDRLHAEGLLA